MVQFMSELLDIRDLNDHRRPLADSQRVKFTREIKGRSIVVLVFLLLLQVFLF